MTFYSTLHIYKLKFGHYESLTNFNFFLRCFWCESKKIVHDQLTAGNLQPSIQNSLQIYVNDHLKYFQCPTLRDLHLHPLYL